MSEFLNRRSVLLVDDEDALRSAVNEYLSDAGYDVVESHSGPDAIAKVVQEDFDAIISDIRMPEMSGLDLIHVLEKLCENTIILLLTAVPDPDANLAVLAREAGVYAYLTKPCKLKVIKETLDQAFAQKDAKNEETEAVEPMPHANTEPSRPLTKSLNAPNEIMPEPVPPETEVPKQQISTADSYFLAEIESIISDLDQTPLQDEDDLKLEIELFSHRYGDLHLNNKRSIKREIEDVLLKPKVDIRQLSPLEFVDLSKNEFLSRGWENWVPDAEASDGQTILVDIIKDGVGIKFWFQSTAIRADMLNLQKAVQSGSIKIDMCVFIIQTGNTQKYLKKKTGRPWSGASFNEAVRTLKLIQRQVDTAICIMGLDISGSVDKYEIEMASYACNVDPVPMDGDYVALEPILSEMSALQIKACVFDYLEKKYQRLIDRNVRVKGKGKVLGIDGLMRLGVDVILEIEMSRSQGLPNSRSLSSVSDDLGCQLMDYRSITGRRAAMRFVLLGEFPPEFIKDLIWKIDNLRQSHSMWIDFELITFKQLGVSVYDGVKRLYMEE